MALGSKVDDVVGVILGNQVGDQRLVADIALHKDVAGVVLDVLQILQVAGVGQLVQDGNMYARVVVHHVVHEVAADEAAAARDDDVLEKQW